LVDYKKCFLETSNDWVADFGWISYAFVARKVSAGVVILVARVVFSWRPVEIAEFLVETTELVAGFVQRTFSERSAALSIIERITLGEFVIDGRNLRLVATDEPHYSSEMESADRWYCDAHLIVGGEVPQPLHAAELSAMNDGLRCAQTPFDGLPDLAGFLALRDPSSLRTRSYIETRVIPSVDFLIGESALDRDKFTLSLVAAPSLDTTGVQLAIRCFRTDSTQVRRQCANEVRWDSPGAGQIRGKLVLEVKLAYMIEVMLLFAGKTIRRQFFHDLSRSPNLRLVAMSAFDSDLRRIRSALASDDSEKFEKAVGAIGYIYGLTSALTVETNAPDLIGSTPNGHIVLVECTTRLRDLRLKAGKLVDRRAILAAQISPSDKFTRIYTVLVCGVPEANIATEKKFLQDQKIILVTSETLKSALDSANFPRDIESMLEAALQFNGI